MKVKLTEDDANAMAMVNPSWADAWKRSGGNIEVPLDVVNSGRLVRAKVNNVQAAIDQLAKDPDTAKALDITGKVGNLMTIAKDPTLRQALNNTEAQMAAHANGDRHYSILDAMLTSDGGPALAAKLGIDPTKANAWLDKQHNERLSAEKVAAEAGKVAALKAKPITFAAAPSIANDESETPERRAQAKAVIAENLDFKTKEAAMKAQFAANKPNPNMMTASMPDNTQVAGTTEELKAAGIDPNKMTKLPAADQSKVSIARQLISPNGLLTNVEKDLAAFKPEELTNIGNRWNEFDAGTLGSGDQRYIALRTDAKLLSTALMQAHVGSKGGESIMEHFQGLADAGKMDGDTLKTAIQTERRYVTEKAMLPTAQGRQSEQKAPSVVPAGAFAHRTNGVIDGYKTADGKVVMF